MNSRKEGPVSQFKYAPNLIKWVNDNLIKSKEQFESFPEHQVFTMGYVEYQKVTKNGEQEPCIAFAEGEYHCIYYTYLTHILHIHMLISSPICS